MNNRVAASDRAGTGQTPLSKAEKRAAAKAAKARAAAAARRRRMLSIAGTALAVLAIIAVVVVLAIRSEDSTSTAQSGATTPSAADSSAAAPSAAAPSAAAAFPPLPPGADPALSTKPAAKAGSGAVTKLAVTTLIEGKGAAAQAGQTITVNYVGVTFADGKEFDSSWNSSQPFSFALGGGQVIKGWDQGLVGVKVGSRVQLDIPAALAYGDNPSNGPAGALRFIVDVLSVA